MVHGAKGEIPRETKMMAAVCEEGMEALPGVMRFAPGKAD